MGELEFEYFSFFVIAKLFSARNVKKNVFTVFTVPIGKIGGFWSGQNLSNS